MVLWYIQGYYKYPEPYETDDIKITFHSVLNKKNPTVCPHCNGNHAGIQKEANDLYCFYCGWREAEYFNKRVNSIIRWIERQEAKYGKPLLLSDRELKAIEDKRRLGREYIKRARADGRAKPASKEKQRLYYQHSMAREGAMEDKQEYMREYNKTHRQQKLEWQRKYREKKRELAEANTW